MTAPEQTVDTQGALRGIRVVEFGQYIPGPLLGMLLAEQGADVIKVERPGGDPARSEPAFATWNRSKRSVVLELKSARRPGREAHELVNWADVLIENFRPGVADRLGIGYEASQDQFGAHLLLSSWIRRGQSLPERVEDGSTLLALPRARTKALLAWTSRCSCHCLQRQQHLPPSVGSDLRGDGTDRSSAHR